MDLIATLDFKKLFLQNEVYELSESPMEKSYDSDSITALLKPGIKMDKSLARLGNDLLHDVEMFTSYMGNSDETVMNKLNHTSLEGSHIYLESLLANPISSVDLLRARSTQLKRIETVLKPRHHSLLEQLKENEQAIFFIYSATDEELSELYNIVYFNAWFLSFLNGNDKALTILNSYKVCISPLIGILSPIVYFVVPYFVLRLKFKVKMGFFTYLKFIFKSFLAGMGTDSFLGLSPSLSKIRYISYGLSLLFYFQNIFSNIEIAKLIYKISSFLTTKINSVVKYVQASGELIDQLWHPDCNLHFWNDQELQHCPNCNLFPDVKNSPFSILNNYGRQLSLFKRFNKSDYVQHFKKVYMLDTLISTIKAKSMLNLSFADFRSTDQATLKVTNVTHPCLESKKAVGNSLDLTKERSIIITGPNAGGKSTLIKSIMTAVIMAQTVTLVSAASIVISPFYLINSQINIPDCKGKESLFEAEMNRSKESIKMLEEADAEGKPSFIVMDEIFNSTNPVEGISGAFAIAKKVASFKKNIGLITTHYLYLTKLKKECGFANYKMNIIHKDDGTIVYPYKLSRGVSTQYIALELLALSGFDKELVADAIAVRDRLVKRNSEFDSENKSS